MRQAVHTLEVGSNDGSDFATSAIQTATAEDIDVAGLLPFGPVELIAEGGMALVYRGHDAERGCPVAIKVLRCALAGHVELVEAFAAEHGMVSRIAHPGVVAIHSSGDVDGVPFLVMDLCDGQTLADIIAYEPLSLRRVAVLGAQLAAALDAAHTAGVIHCDVKPENVIVSRHTGEARLLDFGVARRIDAAASDIVSGTPAYMAPEQWLGAAAPASDIYALGCVLFELVTGAPPFDGGFAEVMAAHQNDAPPPLRERRPGLPMALEALITSMLAKAPESRPASMAVVAARLAALAQPARRSALSPGCADLRPARDLAQATA